MKLNRLVSTSGMDHETWLEYRKKGIGGSDAGSICGLNPYATAIGCADVPDPSGMKHKQMRYEGIIDMDSDQVYWLN